MRLLDLLLPLRCAVCGVGGEQLCDRCRETLSRLLPPLCERCGAPTAWPVARCRECSGRRLAFASARSAVAYDDAVRRLVAGWKEHGLRRLAAVVADLVFETLRSPQAPALAFVPADRDRALRRGHHPAERLAHELGERWSLPVLSLLERSRAVPRQTGLELTERRRNMSGAFRANGPSPRAVAVVDDVYTSGATAAAAASALRKAGARRVEIITFARAVR